MKGEAYELKNFVWNESLQRMWLTMVGSIVGVVLIVFGSVWAWRVFKRNYHQRVLKMKPEVVSSES